MLIATQATNIAGTQKYFETVLTQGDYYLGQEVAGYWHGVGAQVLGLGVGTQVTGEAFAALLAGQHPTSGKRLAQRVRKDRRPGMDLTFSVPKSVSLAWALGEDERVVEALRDAVRETMARDVEPLMQRRVRDGLLAHTKQKTSTGKLIYADFLHKTSRPVEGQADPHLHIHAFVINWTEQNGKHYAGEFEEIVRQRKSLQAKFDARLAGKLTDLGYEVEQVRFLQSGRLKSGWEIRGIERATIEKFSRRTEQIEEYAKEHGIEAADKKGRLGKLTREKKNEGQSVDELRQLWQDRLTAAERAAMAALIDQGSGHTEQGDTGQGDTERAIAAVQFALDHHLFRQSTVERHAVVATALEQGLTLRPELVERTLDQMQVIRRETDALGTKRHFITTRAVLESEQQVIAFARDGRGTRRAISEAKHEFRRDWLNDQQKEAVSHVLQSRDRVTAIVGGAGTGKTSLMQEAVEAIERHGKRVFTFAPSTGAKEVLQQKGFAETETVAHLICNTSCHKRLDGQVVWIDEAGLLDVRSMNEVFRVAKEQNCRVVLSGDTRQHASPRRGDAMRLLEREAGLNLARAEKIQRQRGQYRRAVQLISKGHEIVDQRTGKTGLVAGFDLLDKMGKIKEISGSERHTALAKTYVKTIERGKSSLIVAPTHAEAKAATAEIRELLRGAGRLDSKERTVTQLKSLNLSDAEKSQPQTYQNPAGMVVEFHQHSTGGFKKGDRYQVVGLEDGQVQLATLDGKRVAQLPLQSAPRFEVYEQQPMALAKGDKVRFTLGGTSQNGKSRISNGRLDEVKGFDRSGNLILQNGWVVDKDYGHVDLGYVITSHASQGKDRDLAIAAIGSQSLPAVNAKQFYVTASRGKEDVVIFVDDKAQVRQAIQRSGERMSATELVQRPDRETFRERTSYEQSRSRSFGHSFRDRVMQWWRHFRGERTAQPSHGVSRGADSGRAFGSPATPSPGRSM